MRLDRETSSLPPSSVFRRRSLRCLGASSYLLGGSWLVLGASWPVFGGFRGWMGRPNLHLGAILDLFISILATQWSKFGFGTCPGGHFWRMSRTESPLSGAAEEMWRGGEERVTLQILVSGGGSRRGDITLTHAFETPCQGSAYIFWIFVHRPKKIKSESEDSLLSKYR